MYHRVGFLLIASYKLPVFYIRRYYIFRLKWKKNSLKECVFVNSALKSILLTGKVKLI